MTCSLCFFQCYGFCCYNTFYHSLDLFRCPSNRAAFLYIERPYNLLKRINFSSSLIMLHSTHIRLGNCRKICCDFHFLIFSLTFTKSPICGSFIEVLNSQIPKLIWERVFKVDLSPSKKICYLLHWKIFKNDKKCILFHLKSSFRSHDFSVFVMTFWSCRKNYLIGKIRLIQNSWCYNLLNK